MREVEIAALLDEVYAGQKRLSSAMLHRYAVAAEAPPELIAALDGLPEGEYDQDEVAEALAQLAQLTGTPRATAPAVPAVGVPANQLADDDLLRELGEVHRTRNTTLRHGSEQSLARHDERMAELETEYLRRFPMREVDPQRLREGARTREQISIRALEDTDQVAWAVDDEAPVPALATGGGEAGPGFREPRGQAAGPGPRASTSGSGSGSGGSSGSSSGGSGSGSSSGGGGSGGGGSGGGGSGGGAGGGGGSTGGRRTGRRSPRSGAEQPWDPQDLAMAEGHDPTPAAIERARRELAEEGAAAIERTVP